MVVNPYLLLLFLQVQQLENELLEELELHAFLENVIERNVFKLSGPANLPHQVSLTSMLMWG